MTIPEISYLNIGDESFVADTNTEIEELISKLSDVSSKSNLGSSLEQVRMHIINGLLVTVAKTVKNAAAKKKPSAVWQTFFLILLKNSQRLVPNVNWCTKCKEVVFNPAHDGGTNYLRRHKCHQSQSILNFLPPKKKIKLCETDQEMLRNACVNFVVKDIRPFRSVEGSGLKELLHSALFIARKYPMISKDDLDRFIPSRMTVRKDLEGKAKLIRQQIRQLFLLALTNPGGFSCTTDIWSDNFQQEKYICFTAHIHLYEKDEFIAENFVFYVDVIEGLYITADVIREKIFTVFAEFGVSESDVKNKIVFTTDRGSNVKSALKPHFKRLFCMAHYLSNLVAKMCKIPYIKLIVKNAAKLVKYLKISGLNSKKVMKGSSVKSYSKTRWNTVYNMLRSILVNYSKIISLLEAKESADRTKKTKVLDKITCLPRNEMEAMVEFLEFFDKCTKDIQYENKPVIHEIWPLLRRIEKHLRQCDGDSNIIMEMKATGRNYVSLPENVIDMSPKMEHKLAVLLHPLMKGMKFVSEPEKIEIRIEAIKLMKELNSNIVTNESINEQQPQIQFNVNNSRLDCEESFDEFCDDINPSHPNDSTLNEETEMSNYLNYKISCTPNLSIKNFDLVGWWITNRKSFPRLFTIFIRISSVQGTSSSSERCFSATGSIKTARRAGLDSNSVHDLILAKNKFKRKFQLIH